MCRLGNRCIIADDQLAALYMQRRSALKGQALPIHHERNGFFNRLPLCITAEADRVIIVQRCQHRHCVAVLRRVQRRREGFVCAAVRAVRSCHRSGFNGSLVDRELHHIGNIFIVVSGLAGLGVDVVGVIAFLVETADCGVFIDCRNDITLVLRIANYCLVLRIVICHRSIFLHTADGQQRQKLFTHRAGRLGKRYGQIGIGLVDGAADRKRFFARLELVLCCGITDKFQLHSNGMITRVRGIERLLGSKVRSFFEYDAICTVCKRQVDRNRAAVRRAVIAAANGIGLAYAPDLRKRVRFGIGLFAFARVG